jgi:hypothetical protein
MSVLSGYLRFYELYGDWWRHESVAETYVLYKGLLILYIFTCRLVRATKMVGSSLDDWAVTLVKGSFNRTQCSAIPDLHISQFTVAHALGFPALTSRLLATDLNTETLTASLHYTLPVLHIKKVFKS